MSSKNNLENDQQSDVAKDLAKSVEDLPTEIKDEVISKLVEDLPENKQEKLFMQVQRKQSLEIRGTGELPMVLALMHKMNPEHIHKFLDNQGNEINSKKELVMFHENNTTKRVFIGVLTGIAVLFLLIFALWLFQNNSDSQQLISDIFKYLIGAGFGFLGGLGFKNK